jgi:hypothetical protein
MEMTNVEFAEKLEKLAIKYRENLELRQFMIFSSLYSKEEAAAVIRTLGGKWVKKMPTGNDEYSSITFASEEFSCQFVLPRNILCERVVTYNCTPLLSPEEEAELLEPVEA